MKEIKEYNLSSERMIFLANDICTIPAKKYEVDFTVETKSGEIKDINLSFDSITKAKRKLFILKKIATRHNALVANCN